MPESTTIIAFDQHADSLMTAVLPSRTDKPATQLTWSATVNAGRSRVVGVGRELTGLVQAALITVN